MPKTVDQIRQQIAKLQAQEQALLQKEVAGVVAKIRTAVEHYGITAEQIFGAAGPTKRRGGRKAAPPHKAAAKAVKKDRAPKVANVVSPAKGAKLPAKYKDEAGNAWSGRGSQPRWLRGALGAGKKLEDFVVS